MGSRFGRNQKRRMRHAIWEAEEATRRERQYRMRAEQRQRQQNDELHRIGAEKMHHAIKACAARAGTEVAKYGLEELARLAPNLARVYYDASDPLAPVRGVVVRVEVPRVQFNVFVDERAA